MSVWQTIAILLKFLEYRICAENNCPWSILCV